MPDLPDLHQLSHAQKDELIGQLFDLVQHLRRELAGVQQQLSQLQNQPRLNSKNSSKPPSSDGLAKPAVKLTLKPAPQSLRPTGQHPNGGQRGHSGHTLRQSAQPDVVIEHTGAAHCSVCQSPLHWHHVEDTRQVFELPVLRAHITEHRLMRSTCTCGAKHTGAFPQGINAPTQYGPQVKALVTHLNQQHFVPLARTCEIMDDVFGLALSEASVLAFTEQAAQTLKPTVAAIGQAVQAAPIVHADESGIRLKGKLAWLHCAVTPTLTHLAHHARRGKVAFEALGILAGVRGTLVHDGLRAYKSLECLHSLCNAHHLRELVYVHESLNEKAFDGWAGEMMDLLLLAKREVDETAGPLPLLRQTWFDEQWSALLARGQANHPEARRDEEVYSKKRGQVAQSKPHNLLKRLREHRQEVWRFMTDVGVPFTNNLAEQALRMSKVRQKVSGCFRTDEGASTFFTIRSYLQTMRKQGVNLLDCLVSVFRHQPIQPCLA